MSHRVRMLRTLAELHHGALNGATRERLERHVTRCATCRETLRQWEAADRLLRAARPETVALAPDVAQAVFARALQVSGVERDGHNRYTRLRQFAWCLGLTCVLAVAVLALHRGVMHSLPVKIAISPPARRISPDARNALLSTEPPPVVATAAHSPVHHHRVYLAHLLHRNLNGGAVAVALQGRRLPHRKGRGASTTIVAPPVSETALAATDFPVQARLMVIVTHEPALDVEVTQADADAPGYAQAVCFRRGAGGAEIWEGCTIRNEKAGADTIDSRVALIGPGERPQILVVQASTTSEGRTDEAHDTILDKSTSDRPENKTDETHHEVPENTEESVDQPQDETSDRPEDQSQQGPVGKVEHEETENIPGEQENVRQSEGKVEIEEPEKTPDKQQDISQPEGKVEHEEELAS